jgi:putative hydrolase of the HAD superfamily
MKSDSGMLWVTDADNTLWDTDAVFRAAQLELLADVEATLGLQGPNFDRLAFLREVDQSIAKGHHSGLKYPAELLTRGLGFRLRGMSVKDSARAALQGGLVDALFDVAFPSARFANNLRKSPTLRAGVREGLEQLARVNAKVVVATEGSKERINRLLQELELQPHVDSCIEAPKTKSLFARLAKSARSRHLWMIGDQLDRDIVPSRAAGFSTIYFPGGFTPGWHDATQEHEAMKTVDSYDAGVSFAIQLSRGIAAAHRG